MLRPWSHPARNPVRLAPVRLLAAGALALTAALIPATVSAASPAPAATAGLKDVLHGLTTIDGAPRAGYPVANEVILVKWSDLEPRPGVFDFHTISADLARAKAHGWYAKLRVMAGIKAPTWAKSLGGAPFEYRNHSGKVVGTLGRWWSPAYGDAYHGLMTRLAAGYDNDPTLREVALSRCMTEFAEPLWREFIGVPQNVAAVRRAGYTAVADQSCQRNQIVSDGAVWKHTHVDLALTGAQYVSPSGKAYGDPDTPMTDLALLESTWGPKGIPENNQLEPSKNGNRLYAAMHRTAPPLTFQTESYGKLPHGVSGLLGALSLGCRTLGANSVELPTGYEKASAADLRPYAAACAAN